jgi:hypothetical protein
MDNGSILGTIHIFRREDPLRKLLLTISQSIDGF